MINKYPIADGRPEGKLSIGTKSTGKNSIGRYSTGNNSVGDRSTGSWSLGYGSTGDWSISDLSTGHFSTIDNAGFTVFNKPCSFDEWNNAEKPNFIYFNLAQWVKEEDMTEWEKEHWPSYKEDGGYLKTYAYQEAWQDAWTLASNKDKNLLYRLPNFDADVFEEISGIDVTNDRLYKKFVRNRVDDTNSRVVFTEEHIGEKVTSFRHGEGIIVEVNLKEVYPITVLFEDSGEYHKFTVDGYWAKTDHLPTLYFGWLHVDDFNL